jgi:hypothetical protein
MNKQEIKDKVLKHIDRCDKLFDGNEVRADKEFAYNQMHILALELLEEVMKLEDWKEARIERLPTDTEFYGR